MAKYILGQKNGKRIESPQYIEGEEGNFLKPISNNISFSKMATNKDRNLDNQDDTLIFKDECIVIDGGLNSDNNYFVQAKIRRMSEEEQTFDIYLAKTEVGQTDRQFLKTITVAKGLETEWGEVSLIFSPLGDNFDCLLFKLKRTKNDYLGQRVTPQIICEEFSELQSLTLNKNCVKIGVQSRPGLRMCINGEEIYIGRTGIYEFRYETVITNPSQQSQSTGLIYSFAIVPNIILDIDYSKEEKGNSAIYTNKSKTIITDAYTLDYMYKDTQEG